MQAHDAPSLPPDFVAKLACPGCRGEVRPIAGSPDLACMACRLRFVVEDGMPDMILDHAQSMGPAGGSPPPVP